MDPSPSNSVRYPARPELAVAFIYLRAQGGGDFFADVPFAWSAGELRADGVQADVYEVRYERGQDAYNRLLDDDLRARLSAGGYGLLVVEACWDERMFAIAKQLDALLCETAPAAAHPQRRVDFRLRHFTRDRQSLRQLVARLRAGEELQGLPNLLVQRAADEAPTPVGPERINPPEPAARMPFVPIADMQIIGAAMDETGASPPVRKTLDTNDGCPFSKPVRDNEVFEGADLSGEDVTLAGCSFCFMGGDYRALPWRETVDVHLNQIATWQGQLSQLDEVVLRDQHAIRYLPQLLSGAIERGLRPLGVLVPGRGDAILRYAETLREAVEVARGSGFWFTLYLIGFESFSGPQLARFNKGVTSAQYAEALSALWALHHEAPETFRLTAYGASSFILWDPWTSLEDLQANVDFIQEHAVRRLSRGFAHTRLRLYPNLPLYHLAARDGLLLQGQGAADRGAAHTGYAAEAPWLTADGRVALVEELSRRLLRQCRPEAQLGALRASLRWVRAGYRDATSPMDAARLSPSAVAPAAERSEVAEAEANWRRLRRQWRQQSREEGAPQGQPAASGVRGESSDEAVRSWRAQVERRRRRRSLEHERVAADAARTLTLGAACNNRCQTCVVDHDRFGLGPTPTQIEAAASASARQGAPVTIGGREPLLLPGVLRLVRQLRGAGATRVELITNGRALANDGVSARLAKAGVTELLIKRHHLEDADEDRFARADGAGAELSAGLPSVSAAGLRWRLLIVVAHGAEQELPHLVRWAAARGAFGVQVQVTLAEVDLLQPARLIDALEEASAVASELGLRYAIEGD